MAEDIIHSLPEEIAALTARKPYMENTVGMSGARVLQFENMVLKIQPCSPRADRELAMLRWLAGRIPVPEVLAAAECSGQNYCLMTRVPGKMACDGSFLDNPQLLIDQLGDALELWWAVEELDSCPVYRDQAAELADARFQVEHGLVDREKVEPETFGPGGFRDPEALLRWLEDNRPDFEPVLSHGDFCLPNVFLTPWGVGGFIDLGDAGVGDRWRDIALCWRSIRDNSNGSYGRVREDIRPDALFERLGIAQDRDKLRWYLLLDELF